MAILINVESPYNGEIENSYVHIKTLLLDKRSSEVLIQLAVYTNQETRENNNKMPFGCRDVVFNNNNNEFRYIDIKTELDALLAKVYTIVKSKNNFEICGCNVDMTEAIDS